MTPYTQLLGKCKGMMDLSHPEMTIAEKTALINLLTLLYRALLKKDPSCDPVDTLAKSLTIRSTEEWQWFHSYSMIAVALIDNRIDDSEIHKYGLETGQDIMKMVQKCLDSYLPF